MNRKILSGVAVLLLIGIVVAVSGCTGDSASEQLVGNYSIKDAQSKDAMGNRELVVPLPEGTSKVRVVYDLKARSSYGMGSNGNIGVNIENVASDSGKSVIGFDNEYLESGAGESAKGEKTFGSGKIFYYSGNYASGTFAVYATV